MPWAKKGSPKYYKPWVQPDSTPDPSILHISVVALERWYKSEPERRGRSLVTFCFSYPSLHCLNSPVRAAPPFLGRNSSFFRQTRAEIRASPYGQVFISTLFKASYEDLLPQLLRDITPRLTQLLRATTHISKLRVLDWDSRADPPNLLTRKKMLQIAWEPPTPIPQPGCL